MLYLIVRGVLMNTKKKREKPSEDKHYIQRGLWVKIRSKFSLSMEGDSGTLDISIGLS